MVSIGVSSDIAEFAVEALRRWWQEPGRERYGRPSRLLITADREKPWFCYLSHHMIHGVVVAPDELTDRYR